MKNFIGILTILVCSTPLFAQPHQPGVLLLPFTIINGSGAPWIGEAVQQTLSADLRNASIGHADAPGADDSAAIARIAHQASADFVIEGQVQLVEDQVRLTATLFNNAGTSVATAKATGDLRHLFDLEDALADQIRDGLAKATASHRPISRPIPTIESSGPIRIAAAKTLPVGTIPETYSSTALRDGRDRYLYQVPSYGCFGGYGGCGCYGYGFGFGGFGCGFGGVFNGSYSTGGRSGLAW